MTIIRTIIFTILVPGTVAGLIPYQLARVAPGSIEAGALRFLGLALMLGGFFAYALCASRFLTEGGGTPAIWFTKSISFLIGEEPGKLVVQGLYRFSRNPMYVGVLGFVLGEALWFEKRVLIAYTITLWLFLHVVVVFIEEPHLRKKQGAQYDAYCRSVPRWFRICPRRNA